MSLAKSPANDPPTLANKKSYHKAQIAVHWGVFLLFAINFIMSDGMGAALKVKLEGGTPEGLTALLHPPIGVALLFWRYCAWSCVGVWGHRICQRAGIL